MTIKGIGIDTVELERFKKALDRQGDAFLKRLFTPKEIEYCNQFDNTLPHFAARFAAKEAVAKALGTGFRDSLAFQKIEILNDELGKPHCHLLDEFSNHQILISLTHTDLTATAIALLQS